jgi:hypothetical protein
LGLAGATGSDAGSHTVAVVVTSVAPSVTETGPEDTRPTALTASWALSGSVSV